MKHILCIFLMAFSFLLHGQGRWFHYGFEITKSDCGAVGPNDETILSKRPKSYFSNKMIYVYQNNKCIDSVKTDSVGNMTKKFRSGKYSFYLPYKHFKKTPYGTETIFDMQCMEKEWLRPDATLSISWRGTRFANYGIGHVFCPWQYKCLKERHIPAKQN